MGEHGTFTVEIFIKKSITATKRALCVHFSLCRQSCTYSKHDFVKGF